MYITTIMLIYSCYKVRQKLKIIGPCNFKKTSLFHRQYIKHVIKAVCTMNGTKARTFNRVFALNLFIRIINYVLYIIYEPKYKLSKNLLQCNCLKNISIWIINHKHIYIYIYIYQILYHIPEAKYILYQAFIDSQSSWKYIASLHTCAEKGNILLSRATLNIGQHASNASYIKSRHRAIGH